MGVYQSIYKKQVREKYEEEAREFNETRNTLWFSYYTTVCNTFGYKTVPDDIIKSSIEKSLCRWGQVAFFIDDNGNKKIYPCFPSGELLENGMFSSYTIIAKNGKMWIRNIEEIEVCFNNSSVIPSIYFINELSEKSTEALNAVDLSLEKAKMPSVLWGQSEEQVNTLSDMLDKTKNRVPFRLAMSADFNNGQIGKTALFDNRENDIISLWDIYIRYRNLFYTTFGVNNVEIQKKERLTEAEGSGNDEITRYTLLKDMFDCRKDWEERVKKHFNFDLGLYINRDATTVYQITSSNEDKLNNINLEFMKGVNYGANSNVDDKKEEEEV